MYHSLLPLLGWMTTLAVALLAWFRGGLPERYGALVLVGAGLAVLVSHILLPPRGAGLALLAIDAFMAVGFLALAIRYASLWIGAAMLLQAGQFSLHAWYLVSGMDRDRFYAIANNLVTIGILVCILVGTLISWRRRNKAEAAAQAA